MLTVNCLTYRLYFVLLKPILGPIPGPNHDPHPQPNTLDPNPSPRYPPLDRDPS